MSFGRDRNVHAGGGAMVLMRPPDELGVGGHGDLDGLATAPGDADQPAGVGLREVASGSGRRGSRCEARRARRPRSPTSAMFAGLVVVSARGVGERGGGGGQARRVPHDARPSHRPPGRGAPRRVKRSRRRDAGPDGTPGQLLGRRRSPRRAHTQRRRLQQAVRRQAVGAVQPAAGALADRPEARHASAPPCVGEDPAHGVVHRRRDGDQVSGEVQAMGRAAAVTVGKAARASSASM